MGWLALVPAVLTAGAYLALMVSVARKPRERSRMGEVFRSLALATMPTLLIALGAQALLTVLEVDGGTEQLLPFLLVHHETAFLGSAFCVCFAGALAWRLTRPMAEATDEVPDALPTHHEPSRPADRGEAG